MRWVVFLRAVNVGKANRCQPAVIAKELSPLGVINVGAVGTFVVRENVSEFALRTAIAKKLAFECEIMICPARELIKLVSTNPFAGHPSRPDVTRFVNVLGTRPVSQPPLPLCLPSPNEWLLKVIRIEDRFVVGIYRRHMKAIGCLGKLEKLLGVPATNRNWNTVLKIVEILLRD
jgi:uncharacterized protein (DUF1697 family)